MVRKRRGRRNKQRSWRSMLSSGASRGEFLFWHFTTSALWFIIVFVLLIGLTSQNIFIAGFAGVLLFVTVYGPAQDKLDRVSEVMSYLFSRDAAKDAQSATHSLNPLRWFR